MPDQPLRPFTNPGDYRQWADQQVCEGCGAKFSDRLRDAQGVTIEPWVTETLCGRCAKRAEAVNHPAHYGGVDNPFEAIKVIEAWGLGFCLGNALKYICRAGKKSDASLQDLRKAATAT